MGYSEKRLCKVFCPVATKVHAATEIQSRQHAVNEILLGYIQRFTGLVIHATHAEHSSATCQVTVILLIRHHFNKETKKQIAGMKNIQTLRHAMALAQEAEIKLKNMKV